MKICRFNKDKIGLIINDKVEDISKNFDVFSENYPFPMEDIFIDNLQKKIDNNFLFSKEKIYSIEEISLDVPVANPSKIIGAPLNYFKHFDEVKQDKNLHNNNLSHIKKIHEIGLFLKSVSSLIGPSQSINLELPERRCDHEIELVAIIGRKCKNVKLNEALGNVLGYSIGFDITVRGPEERSLRKSLDTFSVLGPWIVTADEIPDPSNLDLTLKVNGVTKQKSNTSKLIMSVEELIVYVSKFYTLYPGDLIYTGTPEGVDQIFKKDVLSANISSIGNLNINVK